MLHFFAATAAMLVLPQAAPGRLTSPRVASPRMVDTVQRLASTEARTKVVVPVFPEVCEQTGLTLSRYMCEVARANPELQDLEALISSIQTACKTINSLVQRAHITGLVGYADGGGSINVQGEEQKTLDVMTNEVLKKALRFTGKMGVIASEEEDNPVEVDDAGMPAYETSALMDETGTYFLPPTSYSLLLLPTSHSSTPLHSPHPLAPLSLPSLCSLRAMPRGRQVHGGLRPARWLIQRRRRYPHRHHVSVALARVKPAARALIPS